MSSIKKVKSIEYIFDDFIVNKKDLPKLSKEKVCYIYESLEGDKIKIKARLWLGSKDYYFEDADLKAIPMIREYKWIILTPYECYEFHGAMVYDISDFFALEHLGYFKNEVRRLKENGYSEEIINNFNVYFTIYGEHVLYRGWSCVDEEERFKNVYVTAMSLQTFEGKVKLYSKVDSSNVLEQIAKWVKNCNFQDFLSEIKKRVIGQDELDLLLANIFSYLRSLAKGQEVKKNNVILAAPSGSGKTETFRALEDYFKKEIPALPILQIDVSNLNASGYKGRTISEIAELIKKRETDGIAICFLDEFDKKLVPRVSSTGLNYNEEFQGEILTMVEGSMFQDKVNTKNTLFIGMGAFNYQRQKKAVVVKHMGFGSKNEGGEEHFSCLTREDIIETGAMFELVGRFSLVINYRKLSREAIVAIIKKTRNEISKAMGVAIEIGPEMWEELITIANTEYGCRAFHSLIAETAMPVYSKVLKSGSNLKKQKIILDKKNEAHIESKKRNS